MDNIMEVEIGTTLLRGVENLEAAQRTAKEKLAEKLASTDYDAVRNRLQNKWLDRFMKRAMDIGVSLALIVLLSPMWLVVAIAIRLSSPGPVLFRQKRTGFNGTTFDFLKFRSMRVNQEDFVKSEELEKLQSNGVLLKAKRDPRVTAIGALLRRTSIDEMSQLINVLKGEMSLVGPRPLVPFMLEKHEEFARVRGLVKPGLSGLWQIRARRFNTSADFMVEHDLEYINEFSFLLDLKILMMTVPAVVVGDGAH